MSAALSRVVRAPAPAPPDACDFVAVSRSVDPATWSARSAETIATAADYGMLVAGRDRLLAAAGVAATLPLPRGLEDASALAALRVWLAAVETISPDTDQLIDGAPGPMALGALPFDRAAPAALIVPSVTWCREADGRTWRVEVHRRDEDWTDATRDVSRRAVVGGTPSGPISDPGAGTLEVVRIDQIPQPGEYADAVARAVVDIRQGQLCKVVLARMVEVHLPTPAAPSRVLDALWGGDRVFSPFSVPTPDGRLVGASPELVTSRRGRTVTSHAFAGTVPLSECDGGNGAAGGSRSDGAERLFDSEKDRAEHRLVVCEIVDALERRCVTLTVPAEPTVVRLWSDARLGTLVRGTLRTSTPDGDTALSLLALLHPTPAVGGVARAAALARISALERAPRGYWAGAVGWIDGSGDGEWVLAIRSVELEGARVLVRAGAGIVAESDPLGELAETTVKLRPVLDALWAGASSLL